MDNKDKPAMPQYFHPEQRRYDSEIDLGLTKREYFAGLAMQGVIGGILGMGGDFKYSECANASINMADALLKALEESKSNG